MKLIGIVLLTSLLFGCNIWQKASTAKPQQENLDKNSTRDSLLHSGSLESEHSLDETGASVQDKTNPSITPSLSKLLLKRDEHCLLDKDQRANRIETLSGENTADANLELLLLSSCKPQMTPGIMRNALSRLKKDKQLPLEFQSFFAMMIAQLNASEQRARQQQALIEQLNRTVEELTKIEKDIESRDNQTRSVEPFNA